VIAPRALVAWSATALVIALASNNPAYRAAVAVAAVVVLATNGRRDLPWRRLALALLAMSALTVALNAVLSHAGDDVLFELPVVIPVLGGRYTIESIAYGASTGLAIAASLLAVAPLSLVLEPADAVEALPSSLSRAGAAVAASLNLVPSLARAYAGVSEAQSLRGGRRGVRGLPEIALPVMLTAIEDSVQLAEAMEARGYGSGPRTALRRVGWRRADTLIAVAAPAALAGFFAARPSDWYPYPALVAPPVDPPALLACLVLLLPALPWLRSRASTG
jgi:energy-coupling factor transport system permease protein